MNKNNPDAPHNQPLLGPLLVLRGALIMIPVLLFVFSKLSSGVALAESDQPVSLPSPISTPAKPADHEVVIEPSG